MAVMAVLGGLCAVAVVGLAVVVARLSSQVRRLSGELAALADRPAAVALDASASAVPQRPASVPGDEGTQRRLSLPEPAEPVPVITGLTDRDDEFDLTTRRVASVTLARPLIKVASLSYGVRRALDDEHRFKVRYAMRREFRRQRKMRRRRKAGRAPSMGWRA
jgi:hypothetical protein